MRVRIFVNGAISMRYLHPVAASERFIARGVYKIILNDETLPDRHAWTRHRLAGGGILTRFDKDVATAKYYLLAEILEDETGRLERLDIREWHTAKEASYHTLRATYVFFPEYVQISRQADNNETQHQEIPLPEDTFIWLSSFEIHEGLMLHHAEQPDAANTPVFIPDWQSPSQYGDVKVNRLPKIYSRAETTYQQGNRDIDVIRYEIGDETQGASFLIDSHHISLLYTIRTKTHSGQFILTEYAHI